MATYTQEQVDNIIEDLYDKSSVYSYLSAGADTTIAVVETWYPILGTFVNDFENFELDTNKIKYIGTRKYKFEIDWNAKVASDTISTKFNITVSKNGTPIETAKMGSFLKTAGEPIAVSGTDMVELEKNDTIQLVIQADKTCDLSVGFFVTTLNKFIVPRITE